MSKNTFMAKFGNEQYLRSIHEKDPKFGLVNEPAVMQNPALPKDLVDHLWKNRDYVYQGDRLTMHPNFHHLDEVLSDDYSTPSMVKGVLRNPNSTVEHINKAMWHHAHHGEFMVKMAIANHPKATSSHLEHFMFDSNQSVRTAAVRNPNMSSELLHKTINSGVKDVAMHALINPSATSEHVESAMKNKDPSVRGCAMISDGVTDEQLKRGSQDPDGAVREAANVALKTRKK